MTLGAESVRACKLLSLLQELGAQPIKITALPAFIPIPLDSHLSLIQPPPLNLIDEYLPTMMEISNLVNTASVSRSILNQLRIREFINEKRYHDLLQPTLSFWNITNNSMKNTKAKSYKKMMNKIEDDEFILSITTTLESIDNSISPNKKRGKYSSKNSPKSVSSASDHRARDPHSFCGLNLDRLVTAPSSPTGLPYLKSSPTKSMNLSGEKMTCVTSPSLSDMLPSLTILSNRSDMTDTSISHTAGIEGESSLNKLRSPDNLDNTSNRSRKSHKNDRIINTTLERAVSPLFIPQTTSESVMKSYTETRKVKDFKSSIGNSDRLNSVDNLVSELWHGVTGSGGKSRGSPSKTAKGAKPTYQEQLLTYVAVYHSPESSPLKVTNR